MHSRAVFTCVTRNYLAYAAALMRRVAVHEPRAARYVVVADRLPAGHAADVSGARIIHGDELGIADWPRYSFQYTPFELSCALKPHAAARLLDLGHDAVTYLDGDTTPYGELSPLWAALEDDAVVLTPHLRHPLPDDGKAPHESVFTLSGTFNAGVFAVRGCARGRDFLHWWTSMVRRHCIVDIAAGLFVDQRWLCLAPGLFDGVRILRHGGINAGHWSLASSRWEQRPVDDASTSGLAVDGDPLLLFHYSGMTPGAPDAYLAYQNRTTVDAVPGLAELAAAFRRDVVAAGLADCTAWGCATDTLSDGTPIHPAWREAIRRGEPEFAGVTDPFDVDAAPGLVRRFRRVERKARKWRQDWRGSRSAWLANLAGWNAACERVGRPRSPWRRLFRAA